MTIAQSRGSMHLSDRRRTPRVRLPLHEYCELHLRARVQLLDISMTGALVGADTRLPIGARGKLRFGMAGTAFSPTVQVKRCARATAPGAFGTVFTSMDESNRRRLEEFLRKATP